jgi:hypothetical protein
MFTSLQKQKKFLLLLLAATGLQIGNSMAQDNQLSVSAQLRTRIELRDGSFRPLLPNERPAALISDRVRLSINHQYKDILEVKIVPQTVSIWGQANMVQGVENSGNKLALFEAWSRLRLAENWAIKMGRQVISLDDERFFGELDWAQGGRAHDALSIQYKQAKIDLRGYFGYNQNYKALYGNNASNPTGNLYNTTDALPYKWMQTVWLGYQVSKQTKLSFLINNLGLQQSLVVTDTLVRYQQTYGTTLNYQGKKIGSQVAAYFQGGRNINGVTTQAYMLSAQVNGIINPKWSIGLGSDLMSGNDLGFAQNKNTAFNPYFHTGHKFYGAMDYFYSGNGHKNTGVSDTYLNIGFQASPAFNAKLSAHQFFTPNRVKNINTTFKSDLGQEIDITLSHKFNKFAALSGGYSFYLASPTLNYLKNTVLAKPYQNWAWMSLNITPTLVSTKF